MAHGIEVEYNGFTIHIILGLFTTGGGIVIDETDPVSDPAFIVALQQAHAHIPYYQAVGCFEENGLSYYYKADYSDDPYLLAIKKAYEENIIPVNEETYKRALDYISGKAFLRTLKPSQVIDGYTYLMVDSNGLYKIGYSKDPATRLKKITSKANPVSIVCQIRNTNCAYLEYELHEKFHDSRVSGEWFALSADDVQYITALAVGV